MTTNENRSAVSARSLRQMWQHWAPSIFLVMVFLLGGGARSDIASLSLLRPLALLFAFGAGLSLAREDWRRIRFPILMLALLTLWMAIQLIPLPPSLWQSLPGRDIITQIDGLLGQPDLWRPITMTPSQTWNSLLAMTVPWAALLVAAKLTPDDSARLFHTVIFIGCLSAVLGFAQLAGGNDSAAYLYRITNADSMVGLFANRNHNAVFLACVVLIAAMLIRDLLMRKRSRMVLAAALASIGIGLSAVTLFVGSRAGLIAIGVAFIVGYAMVAARWLENQSERRHAEKLGHAAVQTGFVMALPILLVFTIVAGALFSDRMTSLSRFASQDVASDIRFESWPVLGNMVETFWTAGSGFGSFPAAYKIFEPDSLLSMTYFNHAHNDWAEALIVGGLPFVIILLSTLGWAALRLYRLGFEKLFIGYRGDGRLPFAALVFIFCVASAVDYPLRVPALQAFAIMMLILLCQQRSAQRKRPINLRSPVERL